MNVRATMKKRILPALLLACLLAIACCACAMGEECGHSYVWQSTESEHWQSCQNCGQEITREPHGISCVTGLCIYCGQAGEGYTSHDCDWEDYTYNETEHWNVCKACGDELNRFEHSISCETMLCTVCNQTGTNIQHLYDPLVWDGDDTEHWTICQRCGQPNPNHAAHILPCNSVVCTVCGLTGTNEGAHSIAWQHNDTEHWMSCTYCGMTTMQPSSHWFYCDRLDACINCDQPGTGEISHLGSDKWESNETEHWRICPRCSNELDRAAHQVSCQMKCTICGQEGASGDIRHQCKMRNDELRHWQECTLCGEKINQAGHVIDCVTGNCRVCYQPGTGEVSHLDWMNDWVTSETEHWKECSKCGRKSYNAGHTISCETNKCTICGQAGTGAAAHVADYAQVFTSETEHWYACKICGEETGRSVHEIPCTSKKCMDCGQAGKGDYFHMGELKMVSSETEHWYVCDACGEEELRMKHEISCKTGKCIVCDREGKSDQVEHVVADLYDWKFSDEEHWQICERCGAEVNREQHSLSCRTNHCTRCGQTGTGEASHIPGGEIQYSETEHWQLCEVCGEEAWREQHWIDCLTGKCTTCGQTASGRAAHRYRWRYDDQECWRICENCLEEFDRRPHAVSCRTGECIYCGLKTAGEIAHEQPGDWIETRESTCTEPGERTQTCAVCGKVAKTEEIAANGHQAEAWKVTKEPTCTEKGEKAQVCTVCGETVKTEEIAANGHQAEAWKVTKEPTCTEKGEKAQVCTVCGETVKTEEIAANGHQAEAWNVTKEPTCTEPGEKKFQCAVCGEGATEEIAALGHASDRWRYDDQECWRICDRCQEEFGRQPHTISADWQKDGVDHWHVCEQCGAKLEDAAHTWENGVCALCGRQEPAHIPGDADGDGTVGTADVLRMLKHVSGWGVRVNETNAAVSGGDTVNTADVLLVLKYISGWDVTLQ